MAAQMPDGSQEIPDAPNPQENDDENDYLDWLRPDKYGEEWIYEHKTSNCPKNQFIQEGFFGFGPFSNVCKGKVIRYDQNNEVISKNKNVVCKYFSGSEDIYKKHNGRNAKNCWRIHVLNKVTDENPNLAKFIGFLRIGETREIGGIIFEFYGETLFDTLKIRDKNILEQRTDETILEQIKQLAGAIKYLHQEFNLAHCNITPDNILMPEGPNGKIVLTGLGSARVLKDLNTLKPGTLLYSPHEVIRDVGGRKARYKKSSDYYSFGLTVYYLTSRRVPYDKFEEKSDMITATNTMLLMFLENTDWKTETTELQDPERMWLIVKGKGSERKSTFGDLVVDGNHPRPDFNHDPIPFCFPFVRDLIIKPCWKHKPDDRLNMEGVIERIDEKLTCFAELKKTAPVLPTQVKENGCPAHLILSTDNGRKHIILLFVPFPINGIWEEAQEICQVLNDGSLRYEIVCCIPDAIEQYPAQYSNAKTFPFKILEDPSKEFYKKFKMDSTSTGGGVAWIDSEDILRFHETGLGRNSLERLKETMRQQPV